tara:strand:+ start:35 stop:550 length:516 start_codon:yes stop_codon:yes gene_type:complete
MSLYHFNNKKNKVKLKAEWIYSRIIQLSKEYIKKINHPFDNNFKITFEIFSIFLIMYFKISKELKHEQLKYINVEIMNIFTKDLENNFREFGIGDMSIGKYVKRYIKKFYFRIKKLDIILDSSNISEMNEFLLILENQDLSAEISNNIFISFNNLKKEMKINKIGGYLIEF